MMPRVYPPSAFVPMPAEKKPMPAEKKAAMPEQHCGRTTGGRPVSRGHGSRHGDGDPETLAANLPETWRVEKRVATKRRVVFSLSGGPAP